MKTLRFMTGAATAVVILHSTAALLAQNSGSIASWGANDAGQGNVPVPNQAFADIASGFAYGVGLRANGTIVAWGDNDYGQCSIPAPNADFVSIAAGEDFGIGLKSDSSLIAWGYNGFGQYSIPSPNHGFIAVAAGGLHGLGLKSDGSIVAWGYNGFGQCNVPSPNSDFIQVAAGYFHSLGLKKDGSIVAWGDSATGQCSVPLPNTGFVAMAAGGEFGAGFTLGLKADGTIVAWGSNNFGQCDISQPNAQFVAIAAGTRHGLGLRSDGSIAAWGWNALGQCNVPPPNAGFARVSAGYGFSLGIRSDADGDGVADIFDNCPEHANANQADCDNNGVGDICAIALGTSSDCNSNGVPDVCDISIGDGRQPMVFIPAGEFQMGDSFAEGLPMELPVHTARVDAFYMDAYEVSNQQYANALNWALGRGGLITVAGGIVYKTNSSIPYCDTTLSGSISGITWDGDTFGVASGRGNHPMCAVSLYGAMAFANWRSVMEGRPAAYDLSTWACNWGSGYRLPTEAEWEKAARGGLAGHRFPWSDADTIQHARANYYSTTDNAYDTSPTRGFHPSFNMGFSPVGYFAPNGYGLYDMAGNAWELCNDWWSAMYYSISPLINPRGPASGSGIVRRGSGWSGNGGDCRVAYRSNFDPPNRDGSTGFRLVFQSEVSRDCNTNGIPDDCELDCNTNGIPDECDIAAGSSADCDGNGVPDDCMVCNSWRDCDDCNLATRDGCYEGRCVHAPMCNPDSTIGDMDGDNDFDLHDYAIMSLCFTGPGGSMPPSCPFSKGE